MEKKNFNQDQKLVVLKSAEKTTIRDAAKIAGVHYTTVYEWRKQLEALGEKNFLAYQISKPGRGIKQIRDNGVGHDELAQDRIIKPGFVVVQAGAVILFLVGELVRTGL